MAATRPPKKWHRRDANRKRRVCPDETGIFSIASGFAAYWEFVDLGQKAFELGVRHMEVFRSAKFVAASDEVATMITRIAPAIHSPGHLVIISRDPDRSLCDLSRKRTARSHSRNVAHQ